jgi:ADP-ribose pyrophosphatase YjhB (NUDIX family)
MIIDERDQRKWLTWVRELQAIAQTGLTYSRDVFDRQRFEDVRRISAEIASHHTNTSQQQIEDLFTQQSGYATPKIGTRGAVFRPSEHGPEILMVQEIAENNLWTLPGGFCDVGDAPSQAVEREVWEESGYTVQASRMVSVTYHDKRFRPKPHAFSLYRLLFICDLIDGEAKTSIETSGVGWFTQQNLPELAVNKVAPEEVALAFEHYHDPSLRTVFD